MNAQIKNIFELLGYEKIKTKGGWYEIDIYQMRDEKHIVAYNIDDRKRYEILVDDILEVA